MFQVCVCSKNAPLENYARGLINWAINGHEGTGFLYKESQHWINDKVCLE